MSGRTRTVEEAFGRVLAETRLEAGMSQEELAIACGRHRTHISLLERGERSPTLGTMVELTRALSMTLTEFSARLEGKLAGVRPRRRRSE